MTTRFQELFSKETFLAVGLMSGTSMDGVDAAVVKMPAAREGGGVELLAFHTAPYPDELKNSLMELAFGEQCTAEDIAVLHTSVAVAFANAFHTACHKAEVTAGEVDFIGSHGQTVAHAPPGHDGMNLIAGTLQLGPPGMIAALTGVSTVGDFRVADIALGGQGAPLVPYVDFLLRKSTSKDRVILNLGGIANVTYLPKNCAVDEVIAFDTGPGNMILDELHRALYPNDAVSAQLGERSLAGKASPSLVESFLGFAYFDQKPPKSAGHREFGGRFAWEFLSKAQAEGLKPADTLASAVRLTTRSIVAALDEFVRKEGNIDEVFAAGGGSLNPAMMEELKMMLEPATLHRIDELGIPADAKEAVDFAVLAREALMARQNVIPQVTGASRGTVLGTIAIGGSA
jgi:anhydro-N-acetylmuramic acid kinase